MSVYIVDIRFHKVVKLCKCADYKETGLGDKAINGEVDGMFDLDGLDNEGLKRRMKTAASIIGDENDIIIACIKRLTVLAMVLSIVGLNFDFDGDGIPDILSRGGETKIHHHYKGIERRAMLES